MRLTIISDLAHYRDGDRIVGWGPTVQEIDELSRLFDDVVHVAVLRSEPAPRSALPYRSENISLVLLPPSGGASLKAKLGVLALAPRYITASYRAARDADALHVRCPANISLLAVLMLAILPRPRPRWVKYAGNWRPPRRDALGYRIQRCLLRWNILRGVVTVNGTWLGDPPHVIPFLNPTLTEIDLEHRAAAPRGGHAPPIRLLFVGRVEEAKGVGRVLALMQELERREISAVLDVAGDGPSRAGFEREACERAVADRVTFRGWVNKLEVGELYRRADFLVLPSASEGLPKVVCEALAHGCLPITSAVSVLGALLRDVGAGTAVEDLTPHSLADAIAAYLDDRERWRAEAQRAMATAALFSYEHYLARVVALYARLGLDLGRRRATHYPSGSRV